MNLETAFSLTATLGMGSYRVALFHLITHAYSKALLFLGSGSIIHSMEAIVGYSPDKSQNMVLIGGWFNKTYSKISFINEREVRQLERNTRLPSYYF